MAAAVGQRAPLVRAEIARFHALDYLRGALMIAVIVTHVSVPYVTTPPGNLLWCVWDHATSHICDFVFWWLILSLMPAFFMMTGFFSARSLDLRGPGGYLYSRFRRLVIPFASAFGWVLPATLYAWCLGWWLSGRCSLNQIRRMRFAPDIQRNLWGPAHLWFIEYLIIVSAAYSLFAFFVRRIRSADEDKPSSNVSLPILFAATTALLLIKPGTLLSFANSFLPDPMRLIYFGTFFVAGTVLYSSPAQLEKMEQQGAIFLLPAIAAFVPIFWLILSYRGAPMGGISSAGFAIGLSAFTWCTTVGYIGIAARLGSQPSALGRELSRSSYFIYLIHLPIVGVMQAMLLGVPLPALLKAALTLVTVMSTSFAAWRTFGRSSIMEWLLGASPSRTN